MSTNFFLLLLNLLGKHCKISTYSLILLSSLLLQIAVGNFLRSEHVHLRLLLVGSVSEGNLFAVKDMPTMQNLSITVFTVTSLEFAKLLTDHNNNIKKIKCQTPNELL